MSEPIGDGEIRPTLRLIIRLRLIIARRFPQFFWRTLRIFSAQGRAFAFLVLASISSVFFIIIVIILLSDGSSPGVTNDHYSKATEYFNNQQYDSANYYYRLAQLDDPNNPILSVELDNAFFNLRQNDSAMIMYRRAVELNPEFADARYNIGLILYNQKSYRQAQEETLKILKYKPDHVNARLLIGDCYYSQNLLDSAITWYDQVYADGYRSAGLCHVMAYIYDTKGQTEKAIGLYKETINQDTTRKEVYTRLGELLPGQEGEWYRSRASRSDW
jgi:tetratricopeptide (TPR) repeat protein